MFDDRDGATLVDDWRSAFNARHEPERPHYSPAQAQPSGWLALELDVTTGNAGSALGDEDLIEAIVAMDRLSSWAAARQARLQDGFGRRRRPEDDPQTVWCGTPVSMSRYVTDEIDIALRLSRGTAMAHIGQATQLTTVLPATLELWEDGLIDGDQARTICDATLYLTVEQAQTVPDRVLPRAAEQTVRLPTRSVRPPGSRGARPRAARDRRRRRRATVLVPPAPPPRVRRSLGAPARLCDDGPVPGDPQRVDPQPADSQTAGSRPVDSRPGSSQPVDSQPGSPQSGGSRPGEPRPESVLIDAQLGPGHSDVTCRVWWARPVDPTSAPDLVELLDAHERERLTRFRRSPDRARYLAAHALVRLVLGERLDRPPAAIVLDRTCRCGEQHGKPTVDGTHFSLTHAADLVGVAVFAGGPVGLDVEQVRELADLPAMARHVCSPIEAPPTGPGAFFRTWTRKEALLKATGDGLSSPMESITLGASGVQAWTGDGAPDGPVWLRDLRPTPGYLAAVAGLGPTPATVQELDGDAVLRRMVPVGVITVGAPPGRSAPA